MEFEDIEEMYEYDDEMYKTSVRFFPDDNIATVTRVSDDLTETEVLKEGMSLDNLEEYFPPLPGCSYLPFFSERPTSLQ